MSNIIRRLGAAMVALSVAGPVWVAAQDSSPIKVARYPAAIRLACVGDSITEGVGAGGGNSWPDQLRKMLGEKWEVKNFGVSGTTLMKSGDNPYQRQEAFKNAKALNPDVVVIVLGTNDTKPQNWRNFKKDFEADYKDLVGQFAELPAKPRIFVCHPPYIAKQGNYGITNPNTVEEIPVIDRVAKAMHLGVIDVYSALKGQDALIPDNVHPNSGGATLIARAVFQRLTGKAAPDVGK